VSPHPNPSPADSVGSLQALSYHRWEYIPERHYVVPTTPSLRVERPAVQLDDAAASRQL
jgi:hypothetical protein